MAVLNPLTTIHGYFAGVNSLDTSGYFATISAFQKVYFADGRAPDEWGYNKLDFLNTKFTSGTTSAAFQIGEVVTQATSEAEGIYGECFDIKLTGTPSAAFTIGELVIQANSGAKGYVAFSDAGAIYVYPITYTLSTPLEFDATNVVTGQTSSSTITPSAVSDWCDYSSTPQTGAVGRYHFIYRTSATDFDATHVITGADSGSTLTPITAVAEVQTCTPDVVATAGTYTITYNEQTTAALLYDATTTDIKDALEALSTVETDDITVGGTTFDAGTGGLTLTFLNTLGDVPAASFDVSGLTGTTAVTVTETTKGQAVVIAPPHWLPWILTTGEFPDGGSNIGCLCYGRIFLNSMLNPHQWWCTRVFDPLDFDTSQTDVAAAAYSQNSKAGEVGDATVAMIPYKDHYLVWGCANQMWVLASDPLMGGINRCLSKATGIFGPTAYCWDDKNNLYFLGTDGIYRLSASALINADPPENITKTRCPKLITAMKLNRRTDRVAMGYDKQRYGIEISVTQQDGQWKNCWWLDLRTEGVFPDNFPASQSPASLFYFDSFKSTERGLLMGGYDGYIRKFDETVKSDDGGNAVESYFCIGPLVADGEPRNTVDIREISITTGEDTDGITVDIHRSKSADELASNIIAGSTPAVTKTLAGDGLKNSIRDKVSGRAVGIKIKNTTADETYSIEEINLGLKIAGREKK